MGERGRLIFPIRHNVTAGARLGAGLVLWVLSCVFMTAPANAQASVNPVCSVEFEDTMVGGDTWTGIILADDGALYAFDAGDTASEQPVETEAEPHTFLAVYHALIARGELLRTVTTRAEIADAEDLIEAALFATFPTRMISPIPGTYSLWCFMLIEDDTEVARVPIDHWGDREGTNPSPGAAALRSWLIGLDDRFTVGPTARVPELGD